MEKITFYTDDNEEVSLYVIEQTRINGMNYILVTESEDDDEAEAYILKDMSDDSDSEAVYEFVDDSKELESVGKIFEELLEDIDIN